MGNPTKTAQPELLDMEPKTAKLPTVRGRNRTPTQPQVQVAAPQPTTAYDLLNKAIDRNMTAEQIGQFMDLADRQQAREAQQAFVAAMVDFKLAIQTVIKNARAAFTGRNKESGERGKVEYDYATLGHICEAIVADLAARGITHDWAPEQPSTGPDANMIIVTCTLTHVQGHSKSATVKFPADPTGTKNPLQAVGSGMSYAERYSLLAVCGIATKEQGDDDGHAAGAQSERRPETPQKQGAPQQIKHTITDERLKGALAAIKAGSYTYPDLIGYYDLTPAQVKTARTELNLDGAAQ